MKKIQLSSSDLKIFACTTMLLDHIAATMIFTNDIQLENIPIILVIIGAIFRIIGRLSFTIFCYLLIEGYVHTSNKFKYARRIFIFAMLSIIPFNLSFFSEVFNFSHQNTLFTLFIGLLAIICIDFFSNFDDNKYLFQICSVLFLSIFAEIIHIDYGFFGIIYLCTLFIFRKNLKLQFAISSIPLFFSGIGQIIGSLAYFPISRYNGDKGLRIKYLFYLFYPFHLIVLYIVKIIILNIR